MSAGSSGFMKWHRDATVAIRYAFGQDSSYVADFERIRFAPARPSVFMANLTPDWNGAFRSAMLEAEAMLSSMIEEIEAYWEDTPTAFIEKTTTNGKIFLMHGHDESAQATVARFLEQLSLDPVILAEQPSGGQTIIEKVEAHADVGYAVALLTADDIGSRRGEDVLQPRARQNVIFELGYFIGRLGRKKVCALTKGEPEIPSDYSGVVYIPMESDAWKEPLFRELKAAGLGVDANKAFGK